MRKATALSMVAGLIVLFLSIALQNVQARENGKKIQEAAGTMANDAYRPFLINNIMTWYSNTGDGSFNPNNLNSGFEFPRGSSKFCAFEDGLVWGGFHKGRALPKVGGSTYWRGMQAGVIVTPGGAYEGEPPIADDPSLPKYRCYTVRPDVTPSTPFFQVQVKLEAEAALISRYTVVSAQNLYDIYVQDWNAWPAKDGLPAPYTDLNGDGKYDPTVDVPGQPGADETLYYVANDADPNRASFAGSTVIGLEMHRTVWAYEQPGALGNTIFERTLLINKSGAPVDSMFIVQWADPDVGDAVDDFVGCDRNRNLGFAYNGKPTDATYGAGVPATGYELLQGPYVPSPGDSARFRMSYHKGFRNLGMSAFVFFNCCTSGYPDPPRGPGGDEQWYRVMNGLVSNQGVPFINPMTGEPTKYLLDGDPVTGQGWIDGTGGLLPSDRKICPVSGPFTLGNGDTQEVIFAHIAAQGADRISSIPVLKYYADQVKAFFDAGLKAIPPTTSATVAYPTVDSARLTLSVNVQNSPTAVQSVTGKLNTSSGGLVTNVTFVDDGTQGDLSGGDKIFTFVVTVKRSLRPLSLDVTTVTAQNGAILWPALVPAITVVGNVKIEGPIIFSDNINNDGQCNPGENVRFGVSTLNSTAFPLRLQLITGSGSHTIASVASGATDVMTYDPSNSGSYFFVDIPTALSDSGLVVPCAIYDSVGNSWLDPVRFGIVPLADTLKAAQLTHRTGLAGGKFLISVVHPAEVHNHLYVIYGVDSVNGARDPGFTLKDSSDGRILLMNHPLPDSLGHDIPVTDGFKVLRGDIDINHGYKSYEVPNGNRPWSWVNATYLYLEGFGGAIGAGPTSWLGARSTVKPNQISSVLIRFATTDQQGYLLSSNDSVISYAYRYLRNASQVPAKPEFNRFILNPTTGYAFQDYTRILPFAAYDIGKTPPVRLMVGFLENNVAGGTVDGMYWPPSMGDNLDNSTASGPREWFFIFDVPYSTVADPQLQTDILNSPVPLMWWGTPTRRLASFHEGDELVIRAFAPPTSRDIWTFNPQIIESVDLEPELPASFSLDQNYPNPFNPVTIIHYTIAGGGGLGSGPSDRDSRSRQTARPELGARKTSLVVYDVLGRQVAMLVNEKQQPGTYQVRFDGARLASGVYFYRLTSGSFIQTRKMMLLK